VDVAVVAKASIYRKNMKTSKDGLQLIKDFEGLELNAYKCAAGVWTIGYGHIKGVQEGMSISEARANEMLNEELTEYENYINKGVTVPLSQCQFDAMVSWVYNLGNGNLTSSTLLKVLNSGDYAGVPAQMLRWNKAGGKVLAGLTRRRQAEADMFSAT
jgi:lysozyme